MFYSGRDGSLYVGAVRLARVSGWSLSSSVDAMETTDLGADARSYTPGLKAATGSASIFYYDDAPKELLGKVIKNGPATDSDVVQLDLRWGTKSVKVNALVTGAELSCQVGSVMQANINFSVTGDYAGIAL